MTLYASASPKSLQLGQLPVQIHQHLSPSLHPFLLYSAFSISIDFILFFEIVNSRHQYSPFLWCGCSMDVLEKHAYHQELEILKTERPGRSWCISGIRTIHVSLSLSRVNSVPPMTPFVSLILVSNVLLLPLLPIRRISISGHTQIDCLA